MAAHALPRGVLKPRRFKAPAMARNDVAPVACISAITGKMLAAKSSPIFSRAPTATSRAASRFGLPSLTPFAARRSTRALGERGVEIQDERIDVRMAFDMDILVCYILINARRRDRYRTFRPWQPA